MLMKLVVSCFAVLASSACNSGRVFFDDKDTHAQHGGGYSLNYEGIELHPLPELQSPDYDRYQAVETTEQRFYPVSNGISSLNIWFIPRVIGLPVIRRFSVHHAYSQADEISTRAYCSYRLEYNVVGEDECGDEKRCLALKLAVTHVMPSFNAPQQPCGQPPREEIDVIEDLNEQTFTFREDLLPEWVEPDLNVDVRAWRRSVAPQWRAVASNPMLSPLRLGNAYVAGDRVLIYGTSVSGGFKGAWYKPASDQWEALPTENAPVFDRFGAWAWVGDRLLVVTNGKATWLEDNVWTDAPIDGLPDYTAQGSPGCIRMAATGTEIMIWGSELVNDEPVSKGAVLDVDGDAWRAVTPGGAPNARCYHDLNALSGEFVVTGTDGNQTLFYPQGNGLWVSMPAVSDDSPLLLDTFMWGDQHGVIYRDELNDSATKSLGSTALDWLERNAFYRYNMGWTNVGQKLVMFGGLREETVDGEDEIVMISDGMMIFAEDVAPKPLVFPPTDLLGARVKPLVAYVPSGNLFVWGGCVRYVNGQCATYADNGAVLKAVLGR